MEFSIIIVFFSTNLTKWMTFSLPTYVILILNNSNFHPKRQKQSHCTKGKEVCFTATPLLFAISDISWCRPIWWLLCLIQLYCPGGEAPLWAIWTLWNIKHDINILEIIDGKKKMPTLNIKQVHSNEVGKVNHVAVFHYGFTAVLPTTLHFLTLFVQSSLCLIGPFGYISLYESLLQAWYNP